MNNRCLPSIFIITLFMVCEIIVLSACKQDDEIATTPSTQSITEAATEMTTIEKTRYQLTEEELEQYGGAKGIIKYIYDFIEEHKVVEDIRDIKVLEPLIRLYLEYNEEELVDHFSFKWHEIDDVISYLLERMSMRSDNVLTLAYYFSLGKNEIRMNPLYGTIMPKLDDNKAQLFATTLFNYIKHRKGHEMFLSALVNSINFEKYYDNTDIDILSTSSSVYEVVGTVKINFFYQSTGKQAQIKDRELLWNFDVYGKVYDAKRPYDVLEITTELFDGYFGGKHDIPKDMTSYPKDSERGLSLYYKSVTEDGHEDWLIVDSLSSSYVGVRFFQLEYHEMPSGTEIISKSIIYWPYVSPDIEKYKVDQQDNIVSDAYSMDFEIGYFGEPPAMRTNRFRIPKINLDKSGANELNAKIKRDFISKDYVLAYFEKGMPFQNMIKDTTYSFIENKDLIIITVEHFGGWMASEGGYDYQVYYYDKITDSELSFYQYMERQGISLETLIKKIGAKDTMEYLFGPAAHEIGDVNQAIIIHYAVETSKNSYDVYISSDYFEYSTTIKFVVNLSA